MFYVEGIIDSIELEVDCPKQIRFSLMPISEFLITLLDGEKRILFVDCNKRSASLVEVQKNGNDKEVVFFNLQRSWACTLIDVLTQAKCNRSMVRVCVDSQQNEKDNTVPCPNSDVVVGIHLV